MVQVKSGSMKIDIVIVSGIDEKHSVNCCGIDVNSACLPNEFGLVQVVVVIEITQKSSAYLKCR